MAANSSCSRPFSFFVRPRAFLRPDRDALERRAQPRSRLAGTARARQTASYPGHALTAASPALRLMDGTIGRAIDDETWFLDWAVNDACGEHRITLYPVRDESPVPQSFMHG